jgi:hypothetical protein
LRRHNNLKQALEERVLDRLDADALHGACIPAARCWSQW